MQLALLLAEVKELTDVAENDTQRCLLKGVVMFAGKQSHLAVKASAAELTSAFKFAQVKALFLKYSGVKLASLQHYGAIDELRCLNNAIKHNGVVGKELSAFQGWFLRQRIGDVRPAIARLRSAVAPYLIALGKELA